MYQSSLNEIKRTLRKRNLISYEYRNLILFSLEHNNLPYWTIMQVEDQKKIDHIRKRRPFKDKFGQKNHYCIKWWWMELTRLRWDMKNENLYVWSKFRGWNFFLGGDNVTPAIFAPLLCTISFSPSPRQERAVE